MQPKHQLTLQRWALTLFAGLVFVISSGSDATRSKVVTLVAQVQRADYEGDRAALRRLYDSLAPFRENKELGARVRYWRGFALWRRALNGFNENADRSEIELDLRSAVNEFKESLALNTGFVEAKVAAGSCIFNLIFMHQKEPDRQMAELARRRVRAFRIHPRLSQQPPARWLEPAGYARMFAAGAKHNLAMSCLIDPDALPELERMCRKFPETPVIIDHLCRIGVKGAIDDKEVDALCALAVHKKVLVKVGAFYALGKKQPPYTDLAPLIKKVVQAFGVKRCMWESDCPFQVVSQKYQDSIDLVRKNLDFLSDDDKDWLLRRTAETFFFPK